MAFEALVVRARCYNNGFFILSKIDISIGWAQLGFVLGSSLHEDVEKRICFLQWCFLIPHTFELLTHCAFSWCWRLCFLKSGACILRKSVLFCNILENYWTLWYICIYCSSRWYFLLSQMWKLISCSVCLCINFVCTGLVWRMSFWRKWTKISTQLFRDLVPSPTEWSHRATSFTTWVGIVSHLLLTLNLTFYVPTSWILETVTHKPFSVFWQKKKLNKTNVGICFCQFKSWIEILLYVRVHSKQLS